MEHKLKYGQYYTYSHVTPKMQNESVNIFEKAVKK